MTEWYKRTYVKHSALSNLHLVYSSAWKYLFPWQEVSWLKCQEWMGKLSIQWNLPGVCLKRFQCKRTLSGKQNALSALLSPEDAGKEVINYLPVSHKVLRSLLSLNMLYYLTSNIWHMVMRWMTLVLKVILTQMSRSEMEKLVNAFICWFSVNTSNRAKALQMAGSKNS